MNKKLFKILPCILALCLLFGCTSSGGTGDTTAASSGSEQADIDTTGNYDLDFTARDLEEGYDETESTAIAFSAASASVTGDGAQASGAYVTINKEGTYILSGSCNNGQVKVEVGESEKVQLVLSGLSLNCENGAAIYIKSGDKAFITLAANTKNTLSNGESYTVSSSEDENVDGVIFSRADLTLNGEGSLTVNAGYSHAVVSKDDLVVSSGTYSITAGGGGLHGKDCVKIKDGSFTITSGADAIQSDNDEDADRGYVYISGGSFNITSDTDAVQAQTLLKIEAGTFNIKTGGGSANASTSSASGQPGGWGMWGQSSSSTEDSASAKALKSGTKIEISGGSFNIDSSDDSVHTNGDAVISGGSFKISSGDDGMHADSSLLISGGDIEISKSYEGLEGANVTVSGGEVSVTASDDGINAAGGSDSSAMGGRPGMNNFNVDDNCFIKISGGSVSINASGDGIDSNGNIYIEGGTVTVSGPQDNGNGTLDYAGTATVSSGVFMGSGSSGMAQGFAESSAQCSIMYTLNSTQSAGTKITLTDSSGGTVASFTAAKSFNNVQISAPALKTGESYKLTVSSASYDITLSSRVYSNAGSGMGGMGGMGGGGGR